MTYVSFDHLNVFSKVINQIIEIEKILNLISDDLLQYLLCNFLCLNYENNPSPYVYIRQ